MAEDKDVRRMTALFCIMCFESDLTRELEANLDDLASEVADVFDRRLSLN